MNVPLDKTSAEIVEAAIESGRFASAAEVVRQALALMDAHRELPAEQLAWLRDEAAIGISQADAGEFSDFSAEDVIRQGKAMLTESRRGKVG